MACLEKTTAPSPDPLARWNNLGNELLQKQDWDEAIVCYQQAIKINPRSADTFPYLGMAFFKKGEIKEAMGCWQQALEINSNQVYVLNNLAWLLATTPEASLRDGAKAVALAAQANQLSGGGNPLVLHTLAACSAHPGGGLRGGRKLRAGGRHGPARVGVGGGAKERRAGGDVAKGNQTLRGGHASARQHNAGKRNGSTRGSASKGRTNSARCAAVSREFET
ncbi:MAG: tetratricopeptide repeat protein [Verrucomicrobiota bacterium]